jgi:hypothetical protein
MAKNTKSTQAAGGVDTDLDRYPILRDVLAALDANEDIPDTPIERLELTALASGEATYRYWPARAEESEGGAMSFE